MDLAAARGHGRVVAELRRAAGLPPAAAEASSSAAGAGGGLSAPAEGEAETTLPSTRAQANAAELLCRRCRSSPPRSRGGSRQ